ncbi:MAG: PD-(D/E)XK nuclease family protein [Bacteroidota bacterium]
MNSIQSNLQSLLDKVGVLDFKYQKSRQQNSFNIFTLLAKKFDEVHLHSKFIHELLNPKGSHGVGTVFLKLFLDRLKVDDLVLEEVQVYREYKNIDILIKNKKQAVVIENKLYAIDQHNQLQRYHEVIKNENIDDIKIIYLSLDGREPELHSIGNLINLTEWNSIFNIISYKFEISEWIKDCIKEVYNMPVLRETLIQYKSLIDEIVGKTMNSEEQEELIELLAEGDNMIRAKKISENWITVKWKTELLFWSDLDLMIQNEYHISNRCKYSSERINDMIKKSRNRSPWYGLMFKINEYKKCDVCLFIERGWEDVYYGITLIRGDDREVNKEAIFDNLALKLVDLSEWGQEISWIAGNYCEPKINFESFANDTTLKLLNSKERSFYLTNLWGQVKNYVTAVNIVINEMKS